MPVSAVCEATANVTTSLRESLGGSFPNGSRPDEGKLCCSAGVEVSANGNADNDADSLHGALVAAAKRVLLTDIEYEEVPNYGRTVSDSLKSKYVILKPDPAMNGQSIGNGVTLSSTANCNGSTNGTHSINGNGLAGGNNNACYTSTNGICSNGSPPAQPTKRNSTNELPQPKRILFPRELVRKGWKNSVRKWHVGSGMMNVGNTCYLNSTLQALFHVPSVANWLISDHEHMEMCDSETCCIICAVARTLLASQGSQSAIRPYYVYSKLKYICKHLVMGRQEDAHEFLRYLVEAMEKSYLLRFRNYKEFDQYSKETTPLNQILGGYLRSAVRCLSCSHVSVTFQHFQDLLLDIRKADSVEDALEGYFSRERLEDMGYKCEACKKKVSATKQFTLERAPIALCIQLKRFSMAGTKLTKHITIKQRMDLSKFASNRSNGEPLNYRLVSMITHLGSSQHCGHYTAIGLTESGTYYNYDDSCVRAVSVQNVCNTSAYIIFYELECNSQNSFNGNAGNTTNGSGVVAKENYQRMSNGFTPRENHGNSIGGAQSSRIIGPQLPVNNFQPVFNGNKVLQNANSNINNNNSTNKIMINFKNKNSLAKPNYSPTTTATITSSASNNSNFGLRTDAKVPLANTTNGHRTPSPEVSSTCSPDRNMATLPHMPSLPGFEPENIAPPTYKFTSKPHATAVKVPVKSLVPYDSETDEEVDAATSLALQQPLELKSPKCPAKNRSASPGRPNQENSSSPQSKANHKTDVIADIFNLKYAAATNGDTTTLLQLTDEQNNSHLPKPTETSNNTGDSIDSSQTADEEMRGQLKRSVSQPPSPPIKTKTGLWRISSLQPITACISPSSQQKRLLNRNPHNPFATLPEPESNGSSKRPKLEQKDQHNGEDYQNETVEPQPAQASPQQTAHNGYGAPVVSWSGEQPAIEKELNSAQHEQRKYDWQQEEDIEMDRGRQKKCKSQFKQQQHYNDASIYNPFQEQENQRRWRSNGYRHYNQRRPYQPFHRNKYKFQRFNQNGNNYKFQRANNYYKGNGGGNYGNQHA